MMRPQGSVVVVIVVVVGGEDDAKALAVVCTAVVRLVMEEAVAVEFPLEHRVDSPGHSVASLTKHTVSLFSG